MNQGLTLRMILRVLLAFLVCASVLFAFPGGWLGLVSKVTEAMVNTFCPFLTDMKVHAENMMIFAEGKIRLAMTLAGGEPLPLTPGSWHKHGGQTLNILIVAVSMWAAPIVGMRKRILVFPVMLIAAAAVSGFDLTIEILDVALQTIGQVWLPGLSLATTAENIEIFNWLENWYRSVVWVKAFNDGGGRLFTGVLAGLIGYAIPIKWHQGR